MVKDPDDREMWKMLEDTFGDCSAPFVNVAQTVIDIDAERWRDEERRWAEHLAIHGSRPHDRMVATHKIAEAQSRQRRLADIPPNRSRLREMECAIGKMAPRGCPHSLQDKYIGRDGEIGCSECDESGGAYARYTLVVWRETEPTAPSGPAA